MRMFAIDLFCGAGGMTCGLVHSGYKVIAGVDIEEKCSQTYTQNKNPDGTHPEFLTFNLFPKTEQYPDGQQDEAIKKIKALLKKNGFKKSGSDFLLLAICAPCQPFTKITKIKLTKSRSFNRERDKNLLLASARIVKALRPDAIFCENVEGIGDVNQDGVLRQFSEKLKGLNYSFCAKIIDASKFEVPQKRKRTICLGYDRKKISAQPCIPDDSGGITPPTVKQTIGHLPPVEAGNRHSHIPNHITRDLSDINLKRISCAPPGENNKYLENTIFGDLSLDCHNRMKNPSFRDTYTRINGDRLSPTITTKFVSITNGRFGHYDVNQNRGLSIREGALLQTFPENYIFYPIHNLQFPANLIGNAVPPKVAEFFGGYISKYFKTAARHYKKPERSVKKQRR